MQQYTKPAYVLTGGGRYSTNAPTNTLYIREEGQKRSGRCCFTSCTGWLSEGLSPELHVSRDREEARAGESSLSGGSAVQAEEGQAQRI